MKRILSLVLIIFFLSMGWSHLKEEGYVETITDIYEKVEGDFQDFLASEEINNLLFRFQSWFEENEEQVPTVKPNSYEKTPLLPPSKHPFSINGIELGDSKLAVEQIIGDPQRISINEYGLKWYTYHQHYRNFVKVMYNQNQKVVGLYSNQDVIRSIKDIGIGSPRESVSTQLEKEPLSKLQKGLVFYEFPQDADFEVFLIDNSYVTFFYDIHDENIVSSIQVVAQETENSKKNFYTAASEELKKGFELQMFDLTNATRVKHSLPILLWDEGVQQTARKHSLDMAVNGYFDHTNLNGQSPFDRMLRDQITFTVAGENLAYGQFSSIFAHEGLMNSLGHRENILKEEFEYLGVGVAFNDESHPYYTQNYYTK